MKLLVLFLSVLLLGMVLRYQNFSTVPRHGATFDEFAWTWLGINLIQKGAPISWSSHSQYGDKNHLIYQGAAFWIVKPYLEHPPVFGLVAGSFALLNGAKDMYHVTLERIRPLALLLGGFSIVMVFLLSREIYGNKVALIAALLYSTIPTIVVGSRLVQNENFLIPFWLLAIYLINLYLKSGKKRFRNMAVVVAGFLSLAKVPWLVVGLSLSMILSFSGKWKDAFLVGLLTLAIFSLFILYGVYFNKELFVSLWQLQLARYDISFSGMFSLFTNPLLADRYYLDGWIIFGWFSIFLIAKDFKKHFLILIPFVVYFLTYLFAIPNEPAHGWYRYPFYPFIIISTALFIKEEIKEPSIRSIFFLPIVGLSLLSNTWEGAFGFSFPLYRISLLLWVVPLLAIIIKSKRIKELAKIIVLASFAIFIILNIFAVFNFYG